MFVDVAGARQQDRQQIGVPARHGMRGTFEGLGPIFPAESTGCPAEWQPRPGRADDVRKFARDRGSGAAEAQKPPLAHWKRGFRPGFARIPCANMQKCADASIVATP